MQHQQLHSAMPVAVPQIQSVTVMLYLFPVQIVTSVFAHDPAGLTSSPFHTFEPAAAAHLQMCTAKYLLGCLLVHISYCCFGPDADAKQP